MKVALVIKALSLPGGGAERILVDLAKYLVEQDLSVRIISFDPPKRTSFYPIDHRITWLQLGNGMVGRKAKLGETVRRILVLRRAILDERPDVVVGFMHSAYVPLAVSLIGTRIPVIGSEHIVIQHYETRRLEYLLLLLSTFFIKRFTVMSETIRDSYSWFFRRKAVVIPNPVSIPEARESVTSHNGRKVILTVGKLEPQKDQITLVRAFSHIANQFPDWDLRVIGEGALRARLEREVEKLNLRKRISLPGATVDIGSEYAAADIFVIPSLYESFGLATAEAMGSGLPVIGFRDCPGTNEIIDDGVNGLLVDPGDRVTNLMDGIANLIEHAALRHQLGTKGKVKAREFSPELVFARWALLLKGVSPKQP